MSSHKSTLSPFETAPGLNGLGAGVVVFTTSVLTEIEAAVLSDLGQVVEAPQLRFGEVTAPVVRAMQDYGFTLTTSGDQVLETRDQEASKALPVACDAW